MKSRSKNTITQIFVFLQYGNKLGKESINGERSPTYVFPESLKKVIRIVAEDDKTRDFANPQTKSVRIVVRIGITITLK